MGEQSEKNIMPMSNVIRDIKRRLRSSTILFFHHGEKFEVNQQCSDFHGEKNEKGHMHELYRVSLSLNIYECNTHPVYWS